MKLEQIETMAQTSTSGTCLNSGTEKTKRPTSFAWVAQLVEQGFCKPQVVGSTPISSSR